MKRVKISYFAVLRERSGKSAETRETDAATFADLYNELKQQYNFRIDATRVRVAINGEYAGMEQELEDGMDIAYIPPVAGG